MAFQGYLYIDGKVQGEIESDSDSDLHEGGIVFNSFSHDISTSSELGMDKMSARPVHSPVFIEKSVDRTTPDIYRAFLSEESLEVRMEWYEIIEGEEELIYSIELKGARVISIQSIKHDVRDTQFELHGIDEKIGFAYNSIEWEYEVDEGDANFEFNIHADYSNENSGQGQQDVDSGPSRF